MIILVITTRVNHSGIIFPDPAGVIEKVPDGDRTFIIRRIGKILYY
jgi:hypothetical protein